MIIIMLGAPGTGKGTVAGLLQEKLGIKQVSTGDIFRKNIKEETELGKIANKYMSEGKLVPDDITVGIVENRLKKLKKSYLEPKIPEIKSINNDKKNIASDFYNKHQDGIKTAVGLGVGGALMYSVFGNKGQQSNAQLYGQNQQY